MSSTDPNGGLAAVRAFFRDRLVPLSERMRVEGSAFFPLRPDPRAASYYVSRTRRSMSKADFETGPGNSFDEFAREMEALWTAEGHSDLAALAPEIAALARKLRRDDEQSGEVSPFIYVMF